MNEKKCEICQRTDHEDELFMAVDGLYYHQTCAEEFMPPHGEISVRDYNRETEDWYDLK